MSHYTVPPSLDHPPAPATPASVTRGPTTRASVTHASAAHGRSALLGHAGGMEAISRRLSVATPPVTGVKCVASQRDASQRRMLRGTFRSFASFAGIPSGCGSFWGVFRWCRCAQPPANRYDASGIGCVALADSGCYPVHTKRSHYIPPPSLDHPAESAPPASAPPASVTHASVTHASVTHASAAHGRAALLGHAAGMEAISRRLSVATPPVTGVKCVASQRDASQRRMLRGTFRSFASFAGIPSGCGSFWGVFRWCRCAQPPANRYDASGIGCVALADSGC